MRSDSLKEKNEVYSWLFHYAALCFVIAVIGLYYNDAHKLIQGTVVHNAFLHFIASSSLWIASFVDASVFKDGLVLSTSSYSILVAEHCDGLLYILFLLSVVLLFPFAKFSRRVLYALCLTIFMVLLNIIRIATGLLAGNISSELSLMIHDEIWPIILYGIMFSVVLFVGLRFKKRIRLT